MTNWSLVGHFYVSLKFLLKTKTPSNYWYDSVCDSVPGAIRTPDRRLRRPLKLVFYLFLNIYSTFKCCYINVLRLVLLLYSFVYFILHKNRSLFSHFY